MSAGSDIDARPLFYIDEIFNFPECGFVLCGLVGSGVFNEAQEVQIGPDSSGNYRLATIKSLRRNKQPVLKVHSGETASMCVEFSNGMTGFTIRKGMISHMSGDIYPGFQGVAYIGSLKRAVTIAKIDEGLIRLNEWVTVTFEFYGGPEFVKCGSRIFFKEQDTKGVGEIVEIPDS